MANSVSAWRSRGHRKFRGLLQWIKKSRSQLAAGADNAPSRPFGLLGAVAILCVRDAACVARKVAGGVGLATAGSIDYTLTLPKLSLRTLGLTKKAPQTAGLYREGRRRRCIIPVDGFFEWKAIKGQKAKQPYAIAMKGGRPFGICGHLGELERTGLGRVDSHFRDYHVRRQRTGGRNP